MDRDELICALAALLAQLAVPVSMKAPLGGAAETWTGVHRDLIGFGWASAEDYETRLRERLDGVIPVPRSGAS
jgi:hypothetical protein